MADRVAVNARFMERPITGVERYAGEVLRCWERAVRIFRPQGFFRGPAGHFWEQFFLPGQLGMGEVLWSPINTGPLSASQQVVTIHDLSCLQHPEWYHPAFYWWYRFLLPRLVQRASRVLTVSAFSQRQISSAFDLPEEQVWVVPGGVNQAHFHPTDPGEVRQRYGLPERYVLFVGSLDPRKNLPALIQAWQRQQEAFPDVGLVIAGGRRKLFRKVPLADGYVNVHLTGYVPDALLPGLYSGAAVFVLPSFSEGFGLPVLEAMACGTPVIASRRGALPEIAGNAALLVEPETEALSRALGQVLSDNELRAELRQRGLARVQAYSWQRTANRMWEILEEV